MTTVYLMRHSETYNHLGTVETKESILEKNIRTSLSIEGEKLAEKLSKNEEFSSLDAIYSSNYSRAIQTAKYFAENNNLKVNVSEKFAERLHGVTSWELLPSDFELHQFQDENYKISPGESQKEVRDRFSSALDELLNIYKDKRILIISHATAIAFLLGKWCELNYLDTYKFHGKPFFSGKYNYCETFKLEFDSNNNLISIKNIKIK